MIQTTTTSTSCSRILSTGSKSATYNVFTVCFNCNNGAVGRIGIDVYYAWYNPTTENKIINDGLWHTILVTYDGTTVSIIVDGRLDNTATVWNWGSFCHA
jgi:hypothetical protein